MKTRTEITEMMVKILRDPADKEIAADVLYLWICDVLDKVKENVANNPILNEELERIKHQIR